MKDLVQLVNSLKKGEVRLLRALLKVQSLNQQSHRLKLFDLIHSGGVVTHQEAANLLYGKQADQVFYNLKSRLKNDIVNVMLFQESSKIFSTSYARASLNCQKWMIQGKLLISRKIYLEGLSLLKRAQKTAERHDLPAEKTLIDMVLRNYYVVREKDSLAYYSRLLEEDVHSLSAHLVASHNMYLLSLQSLFKANYEGDPEAAFPILMELKELYENAKPYSERLGLYYYIGAVHYYMFTKDFKTARKHCLTLFSLIENSRSLLAISNMAGTHLMMSMIQLQLEKYPSALKHAKRAMILFKNDSFNDHLAMEYLFLAYFYTGQHQEALQLYRKVMNTKQSSTIRYEKWEYMAAHSYFMMGKEEKALQCLKSCKGLMQDQYGWHLGIKLLKLMMSVRAGIEEEVHLRLGGLLRFFRKLEPDYVIRFRCIYKVVMFLNDHQYDFVYAYEKRRRHIDALREGKQEYRWNPLGYEMIRFDEWFMQQLRKQRREENGTKKRSK
jgi:tetratricopeptide (TPR) repeat protein